MLQSMKLKLMQYEGQHIGFLGMHDNVHIMRGWWEYKDGTEGGELLVNTADATLQDYDGASVLPHYVTEELELLGISVDASWRL